MKILFIGDVVGKPGRQALRALVPGLVQQHNLDFVIANGENSAGGSGLTPDTAEEIFAAGVDVITMGDHTWDQKEILQIIDREPRLLRPANFPPGTPGNGAAVFDREGLPPIAVLNLMGRTFMRALDCPFRAALEEVEKLRAQTHIIVVDMHAEATSEKIAMGRFLDGKVSAVLGTHTHVQTADEQIFPNGTAFLCDVGMCGPKESILGREITPILERYLTQMPKRFDMAKGAVQFNGCLVDVDEATGKAVVIERVSAVHAG
jgi:metallophosphoesterase (TIGR00282 family)